MKTELKPNDVCVVVKKDPFSLLEVGETVVVIPSGGGKGFLLMMGIPEEMTLDQTECYVIRDGYKIKQMIDTDCLEKKSEQ